MPVLPNNAYEIKLPKMVKVSQIFQDNHISRNDIQKIISENIEIGPCSRRIKRGDKVALLVGSRGIVDLHIIVKATIDSLVKLGAIPFIVPSMGSHGAGIAEEQKKIIEGYGISEKAMGVSILSSMETVTIGKTKGGIPIRVDRHAYGADAVIPIVRVKTHTDFEGPIESGFCKMLSIGIGNHEGCSRLHAEGFDKFSKLIPEVAEKVIQKVNVPFGVGIVENAHEKVHTVSVVQGEKILAEEPKLLKLSKSLMPRLLFDNIDVLLIQQIGKDISGAGMDPKIVGRVDPTIIRNYKGPNIKRIVILGLSENTHHNATGCGLADFITKDAFEKIDFKITATNCIAAGDPNVGKIPLIMEDEEEALRAAIMTCGDMEHSDIKIVKIRDTLHLVDIEISENLLEICNHDRFMVHREDV